MGVEQVRENEAVYVPVAGPFVTRDPALISLEAYRRKIAGRKTLRQRVHEMPDQTFERALEVVHKPIQDRGRSPSDGQSSARPCLRRNLLDARHDGGHRVRRHA